MAGDEGETSTGDVQPRAHWTIVDAFWWVHSLPNGEEPPLHASIPSLNGSSAYPNTPDARGWIAATTVVLAALRSGQITTFRLTREGNAAPLAAAFWNNKRVRDDPDYETIFLESSAAKRFWVRGRRPGQTPTVRKTHAEVVAWCRMWIDSGEGNGTDKAWKAFQKDPDHQGLSRDNVFRCAWKDAKTKQNK